MTWTSVASAEYAEARRAETQEVLAGYWIVECESLDRAVAIAARLTSSPSPIGATAPVADVRPIAES